MNELERFMLSLHRNGLWENLGRDKARRLGRVGEEGRWEAGRSQQEKGSQK